MTIEKIENGTQLTVVLNGRLDTTTAPMLEGELKHSINGIETLIFDFSNCVFELLTTFIGFLADLTYSPG